MKNLTILLVVLLLLGCSTTKEKLNVSSVKYFDEYNAEINKSKFYRRRATNKVLDIQLDSFNYKLIKREERGFVDRNIIDSIISTKLNISIDSQKAIVIIYYPGKDECNSGGIKNEMWIKNWYNQLVDNVTMMIGDKPIFIFKDDVGLEAIDTIVTWHKDPDRFIENRFFKYHYPCKSFVVIANNGNYESYFGEFPLEYVFETINKTN